MLPEVSLLSLHQIAEQRSAEKGLPLQREKKGKWIDVWEKETDKEIRVGEINEKKILII